ncbi:amino acid kinase [Methanolobus sp. ZRKC3]|uniref:amino acid kinase family protein n=1 Tax=Methanolobus sp. ZRKC3 TaxID=3125786 RepID=UPI00324A8419
MKLGGSLMEQSATIIDALSAYFGNETEHGNHSILIVPGGGDFADAIRSISKKHQISDDAAHWMAILSMEQYAYYIVDNTGVDHTENIADLSPGVSVLFPYRILKGSDELEHSWNITSDTIGAWVAKKTAATFIKVTDVDGVLEDGEVIENMTVDELARMGTTCIDSSLAGFLKDNGMNCRVVNGMYPERVIDAVIGKYTIGTCIKGNI